MKGDESGQQHVGHAVPTHKPRGSSFAGHGGGTHTVDQAVPVALDEVLEALGCSGQ